MTPQERQMLNELFQRLASLESAPRDPEAMRAIDDGLQRAPNAAYPLVQTVLVQDEALKRAQARIRELEQELGIAPEQPQQQGGFLDSMRSLLGGREPQGSVPSVRPGPAESRPVWGSGGALQPGTPQPGYPQPGTPPAQGGSFLGTAAATAAGVIGGAMLANSMRGLFGGQHGSGQGGAQGFGSGGQGGTPWAPDSSGELARQAGIDDISRGGGGSRSGEAGQRQGLFDTAQNETGYTDDDDSGDDFDDGDDNFGDDTDNA